MLPLFNVSAHYRCSWTSLNLTGGGCYGGRGDEHDADGAGGDYASTNGTAVSPKQAEVC